MPGPNPVNRNFIVNACATALAGINAIEAAAANANKYQAYFAGTLSTADFTGPVAALAPADIAAAMTAIGAVNTVLTANNNALLNALLKIAR